MVAMSLGFCTAWKNFPVGWFFWIAASSDEAAITFLIVSLSKCFHCLHSRLLVFLFSLHDTNLFIFVCMFLFLRLVFRLLVCFYISFKDRSMEVSILVCRYPSSMRVCALLSCFNACWTSMLCRQSCTEMYLHQGESSRQN